MGNDVVAELILFSIMVLRSMDLSFDAWLSVERPSKERRNTSLSLLTIVAVSAVAAYALRVVACPLRATVGCTNEDVSPANESTAAHKLTSQIPFFDGIVLGSGASFSVSLRYPGVRRAVSEFRTCTLRQDG